MADMKDLILQMQLQMHQMQQQHHEQMNLLMTQLPSNTTKNFTMPNFMPFDSRAELWSDYYARFNTFTSANSIPNSKLAQVFLTNQSATIFKLLGNVAAQQTPLKDVNSLTMEEIVSFMNDQFDAKRFTIWKRFKFWSRMERRPGETIQELAARIRQYAITCDFSAIKNPERSFIR